MSEANAEPAEYLCQECGKMTADVLMFERHIAGEEADGPKSVTVRCLPCIRGGK